MRVDWRKARSEPSRRLRPPFRSSSRRSTRAWLRSAQAIERYPRHAALKHVLRRRGVRINEDVRAPLRQLTDDERRELDAWLDELS